MNSQFRRSILSLLQNKLFHNNLSVYRRCLSTKCYSFSSYTNVTCTRNFDRKNPLYTTSCLFQIKCTETCVPTRHLSKNVPIDPICHQPVKHEEKGELVYVGTLGNIMKSVKGFTFFNSVLAIFFQPFMIQAMVNTRHVEDSFINSTLGMTVYGVFLSLIVVGFPVMFHLLTKRYVLYLYLNKETGVFTAATLRFFMQVKQWQFKADDVVIPISPGPFTHVMIKGKPIFVHEPAFRSKEAYKHMMGYDKPIDLKFEHLKHVEKEKK